MRGSERRRVVDAVADHENAAALRLQRLDHGDLLGRVRARRARGNAERGGNRRHRRRAVAGQNAQVEAAGAERRDDRGRIRAQSLADGEAPRAGRHG